MSDKDKILREIYDIIVATTKKDTENKTNIVPFETFVARNNHKTTKDLETELLVFRHFKG